MGCRKGLSGSGQRTVVQKNFKLNDIDHVLGAGGQCIFAFVFVGSRRRDGQRCQLDLSIRLVCSMLTSRNGQGHDSWRAQTGIPNRTDSIYLDSGQCSPNDNIDAAAENRNRMPMNFKWMKRMKGERKVIRFLASAARRKKMEQEETPETLRNGNSFIYFILLRAKGVAKHKWMVAFRSLHLNGVPDADNSIDEIHGIFR